MGLVEETEKLLKRLKDPRARLNEFQVKAIETIERTDGNVLVVAPTGSGKTMVGVSAILKYGSGFYLAPLRSLMMEKYIELRKMFPNKRIVITNKDYSISRKQLKEADIRVLSPYKFMLYLDYLEPSDGVVVVDEIHKVHGDPDVEASVTTMKVGGFRIVGLSATVHESDIPTMSRWLNATVVKHEGERPVPLKFVEVKLDLVEDGVVVVKGGGLLREYTLFTSKEAALRELVVSILASDPSGGVMVWFPTRNDADRFALFLSTRFPNKIVGVSKSVVTSTDHDKALARTIEKGIGIHHGGISPKNRELVESLFKEKKCNVITTCFTLSHGVNLPVRYLIITTLFDYSGDLLDPSTFHQISGRAGRPGLDEYGVVVAVTVGDLESFVLSKLLTQGASRLHSSLHNRWTLTKLLAQRLAVDKSVDGAKQFLMETYYVYERGQQGYEEMKALVEECLATAVDAYFDLSPSGRVKPKGKEEFIAARMSLHPKEWGVREPMKSGDYAASVDAAVRVASEARSIDDHSAVETVKSYGLLSVYMSGWKVRELADATQSVLDAVALYLKRVYGWKSPEFENGRRISELFTYGGRPQAEALTRVLRHDELKRVIRNLPDILFSVNPDPETMEMYVRTAVNLIFGVRRVIHLSRVKRIATALVGVLYEDPQPDIVGAAMRAAVDEARALGKNFGAKVV